jgi:hypothetical protein
LAGNLNAKNPFWNSAVSSPSGDKLLHLFDVNDFEISALQCTTHYSPSGNVDVLDIVVHQNVRVSDVIVSDILDSDHLPKLFHILEHVKITNPSDPKEKFTDWDRFQSLASELISPKIEIKSRVEADKAAREFSASIASAHRLSTSRVTILDLNNDLPGLDRLFRHKQRLRKLWQETRYPAYKAADNLTNLFNHCIRLLHFPNPWKKAKVITLPKPGRDPNFPQNLHPISLLPTTGKLFEKVILKHVQNHIEERGLLSATQFGFRTRHGSSLQRMRLTDHVTLNFNNKMSTAAVFLDIEKAFDTTWHYGLLYKISKLEFSANLIKLLGSFQSQRKFRVSVEGEISTPRVMQAGVPQGSVLSPTLFNMYVNDAPQTGFVHLSLFADDTCLYATDRKEGFIARELQLGLSSIEAWFELWNIKINEDKTRGIYFSRSGRPPESHFTLNGRDIPFVNSAKYLSVIFDRKITWRLHIEMIEAKAFRTFIRIFSLLKSERLSANIKLLLHKALIRSVMTYANPALQSAADSHLIKLPPLQNKIFRTIGNYPRRTPVRDLHLVSKFRSYMIT